MAGTIPRPVEPLPDGPPLPCPTTIWRNDTYAAISPDRAEVSAGGRVVVIIGAGSDLGREVARAFGEAGAAQLYLLGRNDPPLLRTMSEIADHTSAKVRLADITNEASVRLAAASIGHWHVLIIAANYRPPPAATAKAETKEWWQCFETNVKGTFHTIKAFMPTADPYASCVISVSTGPVAMPAALTPELSAHMTSDMAKTKLIEFVDAEYPNVCAINVHPGMIETMILHQDGNKAETLPMDRIELPAHFIVWLCSPEAAFLSGRSVWANWDVTELMAHADEIKNSFYMTSGINGWPYEPLSERGIRSWTTELSRYHAGLYARR